MEAAEPLWNHDLGANMRLKHSCAWECAQQRSNSKNPSRWLGFFVDAPLLVRAGLFFGGRFGGRDCFFRWLSSQLAAFLSGDCLFGRLRCIFLEYPLAAGPRLPFSLAQPPACCFSLLRLPFRQAQVLFLGTPARGGAGTAFFAGSAALCSSSTRHAN
ncbi:hypothetical protein BC351_33610 [Paenibacillus ferrarius]|uniref:Uncharacterized protein n=1 Tax=Paenibacillus ferrarius TaxID=1469647 RepID=A0A1V4HEX4_9BACL|nr:hypothetical protein BC351_33610 [Paenibacillus ferrarius]